MSFTRVHHVGLVTGDLGEARHVLGDGFGLAVDEHRTPRQAGRQRESDGAAVLEFPIGEMYYEVAQPRAGDQQSEAARLLAGTSGRGGMQYIALASDDPARDLAALRSRGVEVQGERDGATFLEPATCLGLAIAVVPEDHYYVHPYFRGNGNATGMAHIGIAARSADEVRRLWGDQFGLKEDARTERASDPNAPREPSQAIDPVHLIEFPLGGTVIEISIPLTDDSGTARLVQSRAQMGAVWHHTCPFAPDVYRFMAQAKAAGLQQIGTLPEPGTRQNVVGWLHPRSCLGMLIEVWNRAPGAGHAAQYEARASAPAR